MPSAVNTITVALPYHLGNVNCDLIKTNGAYSLIDTGSSNQRNQIDQELASSGCWMKGYQAN